MARVMSSQHMRLGWTATTERPNGKWRTISQVSTYEANSPHGQPIYGLTCDGPEGTAVIYLTDNAALEVVKGLLMLMLKNRGGPIMMAADDELHSIMAQCDTAIELQRKDARALAEAVRRTLSDRTEPSK